MKMYFYAMFSRAEREDCRSRHLNPQKSTTAAHLLLYDIPKCFEANLTVAL